MNSSLGAGFLVPRKAVQLYIYKEHEQAATSTQAWLSVKPFCSIAEVTQLSAAGRTRGVDSTLGGPFLLPDSRLEHSPRFLPPNQPVYCRLCLHYHSTLHNRLPERALSCCAR